MRDNRGDPTCGRTRSSGHLPGGSAAAACQRRRTAYPAATGGRGPKVPASPSGGPGARGPQIGRPTGLRSAARNNKATRLLTRPGPTAKSSAKDLSLARCQIAIRRLGGPPLPGGARCRPARVRGRSLSVSAYGAQGGIALLRHGF